MTVTSLDGDLRRGIFWNQLGSFITFAGGFALSVLVVRKLGPIEYGRYALCSTLATALLIWTSLGADGVIGRYVSAALQGQDAGGAAALFRRALHVRTGFLMGVLGILFAYREPLAGAYGHPDLGELAGWIALLALSLALAD